MQLQHRCPNAESRTLGRHGVKPQIPSGHEPETAGSREGAFMGICFVHLPGEWLVLTSTNFGNRKQCVLSGTRRCIVIWHRRTLA